MVRSTRATPAGATTAPGAACNFEGKRGFKQLGINLNVLEPMSMYHRENNQEGFLVLAGECLLIVEGEGGRSRRGASSIAPAGRRT
jgi:uncharacterized cupin superfamily protein